MFPFIKYKWKKIENKTIYLIIYLHKKYYTIFMITIEYYHE